jgi:hypothetical protein
MHYAQLDKFHGEGAQRLDGAVEMGNGMDCTIFLTMIKHQLRWNYLQVGRNEDPYAPQQSNGCCVVM